MKERISAGVKILGLCFLFFGIDKILSAVMSFALLGGPSKSQSFLGDSGSSMSSFMIKQAVGYLVWAGFHFLCGFICLRATPFLVRIAMGPDFDRSHPNA